MKFVEDCYSSNRKLNTTSEGFVNINKVVMGSINGSNFSAKITDTVKKRGYIDKTIGGTKYRIDISTGSYMIL